MTDPRSILVTGGAGFIGSHLVDALIARGSRVTVVDDFSSGSPANLHPDATLIEGDISLAATMERLGNFDFDVVLHHAAQMDVRKSVKDSAADAMTNIVGTLRLLEKAAAAGARRFIFASTGGAIYGEPQHTPQREDHPTHPSSPYGCAKLAVEHYLRYFSEVRGLKSVALRYANVYGPRQNEAGEAGVIAIFIGRMMAGEPLKVYGSGEQTRDYVFIDDVVRANLAAIDGVFQGGWNVGTGRETSVNTLISSLAAILKSDPVIKHEGQRLGEQSRSVIDGSAFRGMARLPDPVALDAGLRKTIEWFLEER